MHRFAESISNAAQSTRISRERIGESSFPFSRLCTHD